MTDTPRSSDKPGSGDSSVYHNVEGMRFCIKSYDIDKVRSALAYAARATDIFIVTIPKSGTTWMETIVYGLLHNGRAFDEDTDDYLARTTYLDMQGGPATELMPRPGSIKTHLPFNLIPHHPHAKYICVIRNPKDTCVSFYRFLTSMPGVAQSDTTFDDYFDLFLAGKVDYIDYFDHLLSIWSHKDKPNVLLVLYEQMKKDIRSVIRDVSAFLHIQLNEELLERVVTISGFDYLKQAHFNEKTGGKFGEEHVGVVRTQMRKGMVGDWRNVLSNEQSRRMDARFQETTCGIRELNTLWDDYDVFDKKQN